MSDKFNNSLQRFLDEGRIGHVIAVLRKNCITASEKHPDLSRLIPELDSISDTYSRMRQFLVDGIPDPDRDVMYDSLKDRLVDVARQYLFITNEDRLDPFFAEYRLQKVRGTSMRGLIEEYEKNRYRMEMAAQTEADVTPFMRKREDIIEAAFRRAWALPPWAEEDRKAITEILKDPIPDFELQAQVVSGLLLGLLKFYDPLKFHLIFEAYHEYSDEPMAARALTAIVLVLARWGESAVKDGLIRTSLLEMSDSIMTYTRLRDVVATLIRTRDTDRVSREVSDAFNSTMKNISPELLERLKREGLAVDSGETGINPEWEKIMKDTDLEDKMKAINDMQLEGMDVMMQTFSRLKSFPFFRSTANWFMPFSTSNTAVAPLFESFGEEAFKAMGEATEMCGADRFSFALGILQMPEERRRMLASHLASQLEMMKDMIKDRGNVRRRPEFAAEALSFARDLYRFAKVYPRHNDFHDPFGKPLDFLRLPLLGEMLAENEFMLSQADFYFKHGYYPLALDLYREIAAGGSAERQLYEKIGFCLQMEGDLAGALESYEKADLFSSDTDRSSSWLIKKLAFTNKALGHYDKAADYYKKLLEQNPDDLNTEFHLGTLLLRSGQMKEAMEIFSKIKYLDPHHVGAVNSYNRLKGHEAFFNRNYKEALRLYELARGEQDKTQYRSDLIAEMRMINELADIRTLRILLDN